MDVNSQYRQDQQYMEQTGVDPTLILEGLRTTCGNSKTQCFQTAQCSSGMASSWGSSIKDVHKIWAKIDPVFAFVRIGPTPHLPLRTSTGLDLNARCLQSAELPCCLLSWRRPSASATLVLFYGRARESPLTHQQTLSMLMAQDCLRLSWGEGWGGGTTGVSPHWPISSPS